MKPEPRSERLAALRSALVDTVDAAPARRPRLQPRFVVAAIAAFALAGAGTGGGIAAVATAGDEPPETVTIHAEAFAKSILGTHAQTFGTPFVVSGSGRLVVELGERPDGATSLLLITDCIDFGKVDYAIDGRWHGSTECTDDGSGDPPGGGGGGFTEIPGDGPHELSLDGSARYVVWAAWAADQPLPQPSAAQQAELADGAVTEAEYHAAFERFSQCMSDAGYPVLGGEQVGYLIMYSTSNEAYTAGVDTQCYVAEFQEVDTAWQIAHEDESQNTQILRDCLEAHGIDPPYATADVVAALEDAGIPFEECAP
jgi:hypothetical protein